MNTNNKNWNTKTFGEWPIEIIDGDRSGNYPKRSELVDKGVPFLNSTNIHDGAIINSGLTFVRPAKAAQIKKGKVRPFDVVMTTRGSIGKIALCPSWLNGSIINAQMLILRAKKNLFDPQFLFHVMRGPDFQAKLKSYASGSAQPQIPIRDLRAVPFAAPTLPIQQRIASTLSTYDDLIENNTRRIAILEEMARRLYEEWFVHFRFPGHENTTFTETEHGRVPEEWVEASLEALGAIITGKTPSKKRPDFYGADVPFLKLPDMHGTVFSLETSEMLSVAGAQSQLKKYIPRGSLCVSCIGTAGIVVISSEELQTNQQINSLVPNDAYTREFLFFALNGLRETINLYGATGATMTNLSRGKFAALPITVPEESVLKQYHHVTAPLFDNILLLQRKNVNLRAQRDLLLPKLVSGEIDVSNARESQEISAA